VTASSLPPSQRLRGRYSRRGELTPTIDHAHGKALKERAGTIKMTEGTGEMPHERQHLEFVDVHDDD
jgi:hypothetical protein